MSEKIFPSAWLTEAMKKNPLWEDNVKVDQSRVTRLIMVAKASLLLLWSMLTGKIASYLKSSGKPHNDIWGRPKNESRADAQKMIFDLPHPLDVVDERSGIRLDFPAVEYYIAPSPDAPDEYNQRGPIRLYFRTRPSLVYPDGRVGYYYHHDLVCNMIASCRDKLLREVPLYEFFNPVTPFKSFGQTCHFFGVVPAPYARYANAIGMIGETFTPNYDDEEYWENLKKQNPHISEAVMIERQLRAILDRDPKVIFREILSKVSEGFHKQVFTFNDEDGFPVMRVIKQVEYSPTGLTKSYTPVIQMRLGAKPDSWYETLPLPDKQILLNLDKIRDAEKVVVCPNIEIADYLQSVNSRVDIAFTAFLCDNLEQVDFSPLKDKEVWMLVVNHSGLSLAEAYIDSEKVYNYLTDNGKQKELNAVQAEIKYVDIPAEIKTLSEYMDYRRSHARASITPGSIIEMTTREEFDTALENAKREAARKAAASQDQQFWAPVEEDNTDSVPAPADTKKNEHIFYPFIARGAISYLVGESGIGKSNLIASIVACTVNVSQRRPEIFPERCWSACKLNNGYKRPKFLHLDHENGQSGIKRRERDFVDPYLPDDKTERELCKANYIVKDLLNDSINYAEEAYFEDLCRMIDNAADEGEKGQPVDCLIIDTFQSFVQERDCDHWVLKKLLERYPNMAIVVLHHLENGEFVGLKAKKRIAQAIVYLTRDEKDNATKGDERTADPAHTPNMHDPFKVQIKNLKLAHVLEDEEMFEAVLDEKSRFVVVGSVRSKAQMVKAIKDGFGDGISKKELAHMLGMGEEKLDKYLSDAKKEDKK